MKQGKSVIVFAACCLIAQSSAHGLDQDLNLEFDEWATRHHKSYTNAIHREKAFTAWISNKNIVERINRSNLTWTATIDNQFGDITPEEFLQTFLLPARSFEDIQSSMDASQKPQMKTMGKSKAIPFLTPHTSGDEESFDWRDYGAVTPVHDQGSVGTCWAFSTIGNIEGQWYLSTGELTDLSEEYLVDCDGSHDEKHADCGVFGGWPYLAYGFVIEQGGVPTEEADPYCAGTGDCYPCMQGPISLCGPPPYYCDEEITKACPSQPLHASISSWRSVSDDETVIQTELVDTGPLSVLLDATQLQYYKEGIWNGHVSSSPPALGCSATYLNHAVLLTGFGVDYTGSINGYGAADVARTADSAGGVEYWLVKNSWGKAWGEEGYFRIVKGADSRASRAYLQDVWEPYDCGDRSIIALLNKNTQRH